MTRKALCKLLAVPVCVLLILLLCTVPTVAAAVSTCDHEHWTAWTSDNSLPSESGSYYLTKDVTLTSTYEIGRSYSQEDIPYTVNLCLNGHVVKLPEDVDNGITLWQGYTFNLFDCGTNPHNFTVNDDGLWVLVNEKTTDTRELTGGIITGGKNDEGVFFHGINVHNNANFTMNGGNIVGNDASSFRGVVYIRGNFTMNSGKIIGNLGGGVCVAEEPAIFVMNGGSIAENTALFGGGVVVEVGSKFILNDGIIEKNSAIGNYGDGGGVSLGRGMFIMNGGTITENTAERRGGGVELDVGDVFTMNGGTISKNTAKEEGGGVAVLREAVFTMNGGVITQNSREGVKVNGANITLSGSAKIDASNTIMIGRSLFDPTTGYIKVVGNSFTGEAKQMTGTNTLFDEGTVIVIIESDYITASDIKDNFAIINKFPDRHLVPSEDNKQLIVGTGPVGPVAHTHDGITFDEWTSTTSLPTAAGNYYLKNDVTIGSTWSVPAGETNLCLNGRTISSNILPRGGVIDIPVDSTLTLYDNVGTGKITGGNTAGYHGGGGVTVSGKFTMFGGNITGNSANNGGGVLILNGNFTLNGGSIVGNSALDEGCGVCVSGGSFTLVDGIIADNTPKIIDVNKGRPSANGGGVYVYNNGNFTMYGGSIADNVAIFGGGIGVKYRSGTVVISGGNIVNNSAYGGGGIDCSNLTMTGGNISGNIAEQNGGGIEISSESTAIMSGGFVTGNIAKEGGGIQIGGGAMFTLNNGVITNNNAVSGGGVRISGGNFTMHGGIITGNKATVRGGGVLVDLDTIYHDTIFILSGGVIEDNFAMESYNSQKYVPNNVLINDLYLIDDLKVTIADGGLKDGTKVGISTSPLPTIETPVAFTDSNNADYSRYFFADNASHSIKNIDNVLYLVYNTVIEPVINTTDSVNAATVAEVGYDIVPTRVSELTAPILTRNGKSVPLNDSVIVNKTVRGVESRVTASVNPDGTLNINPEDIADADSVSVMFIGRKIGDVSGKGKPGISDAVMVLKSSSHMLILDAKADFYGDVTGEGRIDLMDAVRILQYSAHMTDDDYKLK